MKRPKRYSDQSGRKPLPSPGRPPVAGRKERERFWAAIARGLSSEDAGAAAGVPQACRSTSAIRTVRGSAPPTRTPTDCCASTSLREPTSALTGARRSPLSRLLSTRGRARASTGKPLQKHLTRYFSRPTNNSLRRPLESAFYGYASVVQGSVTPTCHEPTSECESTNLRSRMTMLLLERICLASVQSDHLRGGLWQSVDRGGGGKSAGRNNRRIMKQRPEIGNTVATVTSQTKETALDTAAKPRKILAPYWS